MIPDFRPPDLVRLGFAPATTRFVDVWDGVDAIRRVVTAAEQSTVSSTRGPVT